MSQNYSKQFNIKQITEFISYFPFIAFLLASSGVSYSIGYYSFFDINITEYISFSEIFMVQFENLFFSVIFISIFIFFYGSMIFEEVSSFANENRKLIFNVISGIFIIVVISNFLFSNYLMKVIIFFSDNSDKDKIQFELFFIYGIYALYFVLFNGIEKPNLYNFILIPSLSCLLIYYSLIMGNYRAKVTLNSINFLNNKKGNLELTNGKKYSFGKDTLFLGQNTTNVFLYRVSSKSNIIFSKDQIILMTMTK